MERLAPRGLAALIFVVIGLGLFLPNLVYADSATVSQIEGLLRRAEANLSSVESNLAGRSSPPKGSAGKLLAQRLKQAYGDLEPAGKLVQSLSGGSAEVAAVVQRYQTNVALYQRLAAVMNGGSTPATASGSSAQPGEVRLGYPHADNFKNAQFTYRNKVEAPANQLTKLYAELQPVADQLTINHRVTGQALATIKEARRQAGFVQQALAPIPANGQGVAAAKAALARSLEEIAGSEQYFEPLHQRLMAMIDPAQFPQFEEDRRRLQGLSSDFSQPWVFTENRTRAAELFAQRQAAQQEVARIATTYQRLMQQQTDMGKTIEAVGNGALSSFAEFDRRIQQERGSLPGSIQQDLAKADEYANDAVQNQKPLWFTGGIPQQMGFAEDKLTLLKVIDPGAAAPVENAFSAMQASLRQRGDALKELIIRENRPPADVFIGADRDQAIQIARSGWAVQQAQAEILSIRIPAQAWRRETKWTYSNGTWYFSDRSHLQVRLIVRDHENAEQAIDRPVNVIKDHQKGDTMIGVPMRSFDEELSPGEYYLVSNIN